ncbi:uncharacterized protein [Montipora capricornis]|uniref:uncharacterized protein n=1 Tax=Montipora capricornis TaxID=246305 RepID=UPI0035F1E036
MLGKQTIRRGLHGAYLVLLFFQDVNAQSSSTPLHESTGANTTPSSRATVTSRKERSNLCNFSQLSVCWRPSPPYIMNDTKSGQMKGIFDEAINKIISVCCNQTKNSSWLKYEHKASNVSDLTECMYKDFDIVLPIVPSQVEANPYIMKRSLRLIQPPGIAVIKNGRKLEEEATSNVLKELSQYWTVLVLVVLLSLIFGILVWLLDCRKNTEQFPEEFWRGSLEGIWWAFVTMATVGYGDKVPRYWLARIVSVIWMFLSIIVMTYLTAIMTTSLTFGTLTDNGMVENKKFGVLNGSHESSEGLKEGAIIQKYRDLDALVAEFAENKVEGMLLDVFTAKYVINNDWRNYSDSIRFERVKILDRPFSIGFVFIPNSTEKSLLETCVKRGSGEYFETDIYTIAYNYVRPELNDIGQSNPWNQQLNLFKCTEPLFWNSLYALSATLASLLGLGLAWELIKRQRMQTCKLDKKGHKRPIDMDAPLTRRKLKDVMDRIAEVERCLKKTLALKEAYNKLNDYWSDNNESQREIRLIKAVDNHAKDI